jgi:hypothetical protein
VACWLLTVLETEAIPYLWSVGFFDAEDVVRESLVEFLHILVIGSVGCPLGVMLSKYEIPVFPSRIHVLH